MNIGQSPENSSVSATSAVADTQSSSTQTPATTLAALSPQDNYARPGATDVAGSELRGSYGSGTDLSRLESSNALGGGPNADSLSTPTSTAPPSALHREESHERPRMPRNETMLPERNFVRPEFRPRGEPLPADTTEVPRLRRNDTIRPRDNVRPGAVAVPGPRFGLGDSSESDSDLSLTESNDDQLPVAESIHLDRLPEAIPTDQAEAEDLLSAVIVEMQTLSRIQTAGSGDSDDNSRE